MKKKDTMNSTALNLIGSTVMVGAVPNLSGITAETTLRANFSTGMSNAGKALPVMGKVKGAGMVLNSVGGLKKASKKLKLQGGMSL